MEFWGAEVKSGQTFEVELEDEGSRILHLSQVALGEVTGDNKKEKGNGTICIYLKFNNEKFVIGTLSHEKFPQIPLDLVLHGKFELSHTWKNGSVYFTGYYVDTAQGGDSESEEELPEPTINPVKLHVTSDPTTSKQVKIEEPKIEDSSDDEDEDDTSAEDEESSEDQEPRMLVNGEKEHDDDTDSDEDDSEEESSDNDQETPETDKAGPSKKRAAESAPKTPAPEKKAKLVTPQKTEFQVLGADGKKVAGHIATPHPSKQAGKASAATGQAKQTPKSGGSSFLCKSCGRSFGSENALQSHSKAKHGAAV